MSKKCGKCPMVSEQPCGCKYCGYDKPIPQKTGEYDRGKATAKRNIFIDGGIKNRKTGLIDRLSKVSDSELKLISDAVQEEQIKRRIKAAKQVVEKEMKERNNEA